MYLEAANIERIGVPCHDHERRQPSRDPATVASPRIRVSLMDRWRAFLTRLHEIACLPELGGCAEELIDIRASGEGAVAERR